MIPLQQALQLLEEFPISLRSEVVPIAFGRQRILAEDVFSPIAVPPFAKSAMDGYALLPDDAADAYRVLGTIAAGDVPDQPLHPGACFRIMTGAMLPAGTGRVARREVTSERDGMMRLLAEDVNDNILKKGEDISPGDQVLACGTRLRAVEIALLASLGLAEIPVYVRPEVVIVTTGAELVEVGQKLPPGRVYNSNLHSLSAQMAEMGIKYRAAANVPDRAEAIGAAVERLAANCDVLVLSGGISAGEFDFVPQVLRGLGITLHFAKVAVQPGMPVLFGSRAQKIFFGLPGNPVSTYVVFEIFLKPFLFRCMGHQFRPQRLTAVLTGGFRRKKAERTAFLPGFFEEGAVALLEFHGSAHLLALSRANCLVEIPQGTFEIPAAGQVHVRLL